MSWKALSPQDRRIQFVRAWQVYEGPFAQLCRDFGCSRKTGYDVVARFQAGGVDSLEDRSRRPHHHPLALMEEQIVELVALRGQHPTWGPKKLRACLLRVGRPSPACSTIGTLLKREGLSVPRRRVHRTPPYTQPFVDCQGPNELWCIDFKGWFRTGDGVRVDPLTITDARSRFLLRCQALPAPTSQACYPVMVAAFQEYGLPRAIRSDNGSPFASVALGGLSRLAVWWIRLGIIPERIAPGRPDQNGRHERMHLTLKMEGTQPPQANRRAQQAAFDRFRQEYNYVRPHEALGQCPPAQLYVPSPRPYPRRLPEVEYPSEFSVRQVRQNGEIKWKGKTVYLSEALVGEPVGLQPEDDRYWQLWFGPIKLGLLDGYTHQLIAPKPPRTRKQGLPEVLV